METHAGTEAKQRRGRRPAAEVRAEVLAAAAALMYADGLPAVTFERVAVRSGASKTTIYKWWPSPGALAAEAYFVTNKTELQFPDTGDLANDVRAQLRAFVQLLTQSGSGRIIAELIGTAQTDQDLSAAVSKHYTMPRRILAIRYFQQAVKRGQLRDDADLGLLVDQLWGACYNRLLIPDAPLDQKFADALVKNTLVGAASSTYRSLLLGT
ncbi:TetR-like C-terminal domain-containing protein [Glaciihabitans sp. dw_435]|uniref:TetR-like C-terminal domain-containing protein n=1 Tax=Glaciihabitans sp. dw_435 TaxID=2720081 RepID=UPI002106620F|nr:TetR-like C-terminal domain-containing protein [Glaciihabitans sp. dw_435]